MASLGKYLNPSQVKLESKGVASVRSRVINLCELKPALTTELMCQAMTEAFAKIYGLSPEPLSAEHFSRFSVSELCRAVRSVPACAAVADDICGLLLKQDI